MKMLSIICILFGSAGFAQNYPTPGPGAFTSSSNPTWSNGYVYCTEADVASGQVTGTLTNFPVLLSLSSIHLKTAPNGIQNTTTQTVGAYSLTVPADFIAVSYSTGSNCASAAGASKITGVEFESYSSTAGTALVWINPSSIATATHVYLFYDNASVTTLQGTPSAAWNSNYAGVWHLPNGSTLTAADSTSNANNGTLQNSPNSVSGIIDGASEIQRGAGIDQYITVGAGSSLNITGQNLSIEMWLKRNNTAAFGDLFNRGTGGVGGYDLLLVQPPASSGSFEFVQEGIDAQFLGTLADDPNWHHVVIVSSSSSSVITAYVDGSASSGTASAFNILTDSTTASIGPANSSALSNDYDMDEVRVNSTALTAAWVAAEYNNEMAPNTFWTLTYDSIN